MQLALLALALVAFVEDTAPIKYVDLKPMIPAPAEGTARIFFYRSSSVGPTAQAEVLLNGMKVGQATPNGFFYVDRWPGQYQMSTTAAGPRTLSLVLAAGQVQYVRLTIGLDVLSGQIFGEIVSTNEALAEIQDCVYTGSMASPAAGSSDAAQECEMLKEPAAPTALVPPAPAATSAVQPTSVPEQPPPAAPQEPQPPAVAECTRCYPAWLGLDPARAIPMVGLGGGLDLAYSTPVGAGAYWRFALSPYVELAPPGYRWLSLHYQLNTDFAGWQGGTPHQRSNFALRKHMVGLKVVPYYDGKGRSLVVVADAAFINSRNDQHVGMDYFAPSVSVFYSAFRRPFVYKLGLGGAGQFAATADIGWRDAGQVEYRGQFGGIVVEARNASLYLMAEVAGSLSMWTTHVYDSSGPRPANVTSEYLGVAHYLDSYFGSVLTTNTCQFKLGLNVPLSHRGEQTSFDVRSDYRLFGGLGCVR